MASEKTATPPQPFLRWVGGKRWLVSKLPSVLNSFQFANYHEPFLGGASIFLGLEPPNRSFLSDLNADLIEAYGCVRDDPDQVSDRLATYVNSSDRYYEVRRTKPLDTFECAARFIYLNHTSFNGIYRVNLKGVYNVPYGKRERPQIPGKEQLRAVARLLKGAEIAVADFSECVENVRSDDLVFLDPPYTIAHNQNGFIKYNQRLFSFEDQGRLSQVIDKVKAQGAFYIMTNAAHPSIVELFEKGDRRIALQRRNSVGGISAARGSAEEYLFTNIPAES